MKKTLVLLVSIFLITTLSACSQKEEKSKDTIPNPISDPVGYVPGMVDLNKKAAQDIQSAVDSENEKLNNRPVAF
ncbi:MAG: hypothetical protein WA055_00645 [Candidatus Moraniibacteriota bacterium]